MKINFVVHARYWYWVTVPGYRFDWLRPWPAEAICAVENDGAGFPVQGKDLIRGACTRIEYRARRDGQIHTLDVDGWDAPGRPAARISLFGQQVVVLAMGQDDYGGLTADDLTPEQRAFLRI